ncbi:MAG TPA: hypothetical protein PK413_06170 [Thermoanaerobaculia bacterium]|nr:hypothetical protein [Thermoanaerobaculia bacterium]
MVEAQGGAFGAVLEARIGGPGEWELSARRSPSLLSDGAVAFAEFPGWPNGQPVSFALEGGGSGTVTLRLQYASLSGWVGTLQNVTWNNNEILVRTRSEVAGAVARVADLELDGAALPEASEVVGAPGGATDILRLVGAQLNEGFSLRGTITLSWTGSRPRGSQLDAQFWVARVIPREVHGLLWMAESGGLALAPTPEGRHGCDLLCGQKASTVAVDSDRLVGWALVGSELRRYNFSGGLELAIPIAAPETSAQLAVRPEDGSVWLAVDTLLSNWGPGGQRLAGQTLPDSVRELEVVGSELWVATASTVEVRDAVSGTLLRRLDLEPGVAVSDLAVDRESGSVWAAVSGQLRRYRADGELELIRPLGGLSLVESDGHGGVFAGVDNSVMRIDDLARVVTTTALPPDANPIRFLVADATSSGVWVGGASGALEIRSDGARRTSLWVVPREELSDGALYVAPAL